MSQKNKKNEVTAKGDAYRIFCQPPDGRLAELACTGAPWASLQDYLGGDWGMSRYSRRPRVRIAISERDFSKIQDYHIEKQLEPVVYHTLLWGVGKATRRKNPCERNRTGISYHQSEFDRLQCWRYTQNAQ